MKIVKYVIKSDGVPILFNPKILHSEAIDKAVSAGFAIIDYDVIIDTFKVKCYGGSESLQVGSHEEDCTIIQNYLNKFLCTKTFESLVGCNYFKLFKG
jgi:hypothetical protein